MKVNNIGTQQKAYNSLEQIELVHNKYNPNPKTSLALVSYCSNAGSILVLIFT